MAKKIHPLSRLSRKGIDSVKERRNEFGDKYNVELLSRCEALWNNLEDYRQERARNNRYVYGDQWGDLIEYDGKMMTESEYIKRRGNIPLKNNVMRRLVNNVTGLYVKSDSEPTATARDRDEQRIGEMMSITLQCNWDKNKMKLLLATLLEEYLIGGAVFDRETYEYFNGNLDVLSTVPNPNYMFYDSNMSDPRFWDLSLIGEIHDVSFKELCSKFATSADDYAKLKECYEGRYYESVPFRSATDKHNISQVNFRTPYDPTMCRVYEIWTREIKPRYRCHDPQKGELYKIEESDLKDVKIENEQRRRLCLDNGIPEEEVPYIEYTYMIDYYWHFQYLTPDGLILLEGESPYEHLSHPYTISLYPFINGEVHSFVSDFIDQQRYINRLITIDDFVKRTGAKGITMVPSQLIPDNMSNEEFAEQWAEVDGLVVYTAKPGVPEPKQFYSSSVHLNTVELVQLQMNMMEDIASVHGALQGKEAVSGTSGTLYAQQVNNSTVGLATLLLKFSSFVEDIAIKKVKLMQQFYNEKRILNISGKPYAGIKEYDPEKARDVEFDLSIKESASTPVHRAAADQMLMEFWKAGAITIEMLLENGSFPFADALLQSIGAQKEDVAQGGFDPSMMQSVQGAADQQAVGAATQMLQQPSSM